MQLTFKYCIDPKAYKTVEDIKAIVIDGAVGQSPYRMMKLAGSDFKTEGYHLNISNIAALIVNAYLQ